MTDTTRQQCEAFRDRLCKQVNWAGWDDSNALDLLEAFAREQQAVGKREGRIEGLEQAAAIVEMDCYCDIGAVIPGDPEKTKHNAEVMYIASLVRTEAERLRKGKNE